MTGRLAPLAVVALAAVPPVAPNALGAQAPGDGARRADAIVAHAPASDFVARVALLSAAGTAAATGAQLVGSPTAWPRTAGGFGRRLADQAGFIVVEESLRDGLRALTGWRGDERPCAPDVTRLVPCAAARVFTAHDRAGVPRPNLPLVAGIVGATAASLAWRPEGRTGGRTALTFVATRLAISFGATVATRAVREWRRPPRGR